MKLGDASSQIDTYTARASENVRSLAFVWLVAGSLSGVRGDLFVAAALLLAALFADFLHYFVGALKWDLFVRRFEREHRDFSSETPVQLDSSVSRPIYVAYYAKVVIIIAAYLALAVVVLSRLSRR